LLPPASWLKRHTYGAANPHYRLWLLCILTAGVLISAVSLGPHPMSASPSVSPTPTPTLTPTQQRANQVVRAFYAAYNRRNIPAILALLPNQLRYSDCDYAHHHAVFLETKPTLRRWLRARFREHDRFGPVGSLIAAPGPGKVGVGGPVSRYSDSLDPLVARGLVPSGNNGLDKLVVRANGLLDLVGLTGSGWCAAGTRPHGSQPNRERTLARTFLDRYNRHDVAGVLALLADDVVYGDCDSSQGTIVDLVGKSAVEAWLQKRFAEGDRIVQPRAVLRSWLSQPPNDPTTVVLEGSRAGSAGGPATQPLLVRVVPNPAVSRIHMWQMWINCSVPASS